MDAKTKADLAKTTKAVLEKCKQLKVSMASDVSARALLALIGTWLLLVICLSVYLSVCLSVVRGLAGDASRTDVP